MGLDGVEIVMEIEEVFGITITRAEGRELRTPRLLSEFVASKVQALPDEFCLTQQTFYRLRRAFQTTMPALASDIRLQTRLDQVVHQDQWSSVWSAVRSAANAPEWPLTVAWPTWRNLHSGPKTIRDLVWHIALVLTPPRDQAPARWTRQQVEHTVRRIILEESGVGPDYDSEKQFAELGID
jgi:hypothetical protein